MMTCSRRCVVTAGLGLAACGPARLIETPDASVAVEPDAGPACATDTPGPDWLRVELADVPALRTPGASAVVERPEALLNVWIQHHSSGCFTAVWRVCTHGACDVEPSANDEWTCPCHGSRFGSDGQVLQGPATRPLRAFTVVRLGDALLLRR